MIDYYLCENHNKLLLKKIQTKTNIIDKMVFFFNY